MNTNLDQFLNKFPTLLEVLDKLNAHNIEWYIGGSGCLFLLGNKRLPDDVDIYLRDDQHDMADKIFGIESFQYTSPVENVRNSNPGGDHDIQLTSGLTIIVGGITYLLSINDAVRKQALNMGELRLYPPEDVLLIKALLQRGADVGKKDLADIKTFQAIYELDGEYLRERIAELGAEERVRGIFRGA